MADDAKSFLRRRAPFYMAAVALVAVFVLPGLLEKEFDDIPIELDDADMERFDFVMGYTGPNDSGISIKEAVSDKILLRYPDGNVYDHGTTRIDVSVFVTSIDTYTLEMDFYTQGRSLEFAWDIEGDDIRGTNDISKDVIDLVYYYD